MGRPASTAPIRLNGIEFAATKNLVLALRRLRYEDTHRILWVDALCINQKDTLERNDQVKRMIEIYKRSTQTLVWLGEYDFDEGEGISGVRDFLVTASTLPQSAEVPDLATTIEFSDIQHAFMLADLPWFSRVWVLQEVAVAKEVTLMCNEVSFPWATFVDGLSAAGYQENVSHAVRTLSRWHEKSTKAAKFCREYAQDDILRNKFTDTPLPDRLLSLLLDSNGLDATDARNHVFALIGLAGSHEELVLEPSLAINYDLSPIQVLKRTAVYLLQSTRDPSILYGASSTPAQRQLGIPSWVPT